MHPWKQHKCLIGMDWRDIVNPIFSNMSSTKLHAWEYMFAKKKNNSYDDDFIGSLRSNTVCKACVSVMEKWS